MKPYSTVVLKLLFLLSQNWMKKLMARCDSDATAQKLGEVLQNSEAIGDAQVLLLHAHKHADELLPRNHK